MLTVEKEIIGYIKAQKRFLKYAYCSISELDYYNELCECLDRICKSRERGLLTFDETMRCIAEITTIKRR